KEELSKRTNPFESVLLIYPPGWLNDTLLKIEEKKDIPEIQISNINITTELFLEIFEKSRLNIKELREKIEISARLFHLIKKGERNISNKIANRILRTFA